MTANVIVAGVGMIPFSKPGESEAYNVMGEKAVRAALEDSSLAYDAVQQVYAGYIYADSMAGQSAVYKVGLSGVPVINVNNNCATGSTALYLARQAVASGTVDCALALGFEQMMPGALGMMFNDRPPPLQSFGEKMAAMQGIKKDVPIVAQFFAGAGREYMEKHGTQQVTFAKIAEKARRHAANNPYAVFREEVTAEQILQSPPMGGPLTRLQCCPPTCGAAAAVICSEEFANKHGIKHGVKIIAQAMTTDRGISFDPDSMVNLVGYEVTRDCAKQVYEQAGIGPEDVQVVELHDCFTVNELLTYEALGLAAEGGAEQFILDGDNTYGGKVVTNPSGGLLSKGHPLGATGLAQCAELVWQLRGQAEQRQVEGVQTALQHNLGMGSSCVMTMYQR